MSVPEEPTAGSVSRLECSASVRGKGEAKISVFRHLAPVSVNALVRAIPLDGRASVQVGMVTMFTDLRVGVEKARAKFERGDVALLASAGLLCFFLRTVTSDRPLNPIGKVDSGVELFESVRAGDVIRLSSQAQ